MMTATVNNIITRGQVWLVDLGENVGSEQSGIRPALVIQNNVGNKYSPIFTICPLTSSKTKRNLPTHVILQNETYLPEISTALVEQMRSIDRGRFIKMLGKTNDNIMLEIDKAIKIQTAIGEQFSYDIAFDMIKQISNIKLEIKDLGKRPRLLSMLQYQVMKFKDYCKEFCMDYQVIIKEYNNQKIKNIL